MSETLKSLSDALAATVEALGPSVVRVEGRQRLPGSGIVWSSDGLIVTAHHVVERNEGITIGLPDGRSVPAALVGRDPTIDVAVLRAQASGLSAPSLAGADDLKVGHLVLALGRPGQTVLATLGIISAVGSGWRTPTGGQLDSFVQTDVTMYPGFSGGPLVSATGHVVGLNTSALMRLVSPTVPAATLRRVVGALLAHGKIRRGYLGVGAQPARLPDALAQQAGQETGLLLVSVEPNSPAGRAGLLLGDTIIGLDGQPVRHLDDLLALLSGDRVGRATPVRIIRGGQVQEVTVVIGEA